MSTVAHFMHPRVFPFCPARHTQAEIDAIQYGKVTGTLAQIMAYYWLLETCDFSFLGMTQTSRPFCRVPWDFGYPAELPFPPSARGCDYRPEIGLHCDTSYGGFYDDGPVFPIDLPAFMAMEVVDVHYNTTAEHYVMLCNLRIFGGGDSSVKYATCPPSTSSPDTPNLGTVTIFGQPQTSFRQAAYPDADFSASDPTFYTFP